MLIFIFHAVLVASLGYFLHRQRVAQPLGKFFFGGLLLKCAAGLATFYVVNQYGGGLHDSQNAFAVGCRLANKLVENPLKFGIFFIEQEWLYNFDDYRNHIYQDWNVQTLFLYKLTALFCLSAQSNFYAVNLWFSFASYCGLWACANALANKFPTSQWAAVVAFLCFPSVLVWSAGLLKESLLWAFGGYLLSFLLAWQPSQKIKSLTWLCLSLASLALFRLKYYYFAALLPMAAVYVVGCWLATTSFFRKNFFGLFVSLGLVFALVLGLASFFHQNLALDYFFEGLVGNYYNFANASDIDNIQHFRFVQPYWWSVLCQIPQALWGAFFNPLGWQKGESLLKNMAGIENAGLLLLLVVASGGAGWQWVKKIKNYLTPNPSPAERGDFNSARALSPCGVELGIKNYIFNHFPTLLLITLGIGYVCLLAIFITFASPNLGSLARYKVGFLPFVVYAGLAVICRCFRSTIGRVYRPLPRFH